MREVPSHKEKDKECAESRYRVLRLKDNLALPFSLTLVCQNRTSFNGILNLDLLSLDFSSARHGLESVGDQGWHRDGFVARWIESTGI